MGSPVASASAASDVAWRPTGPAPLRRPESGSPPPRDPQRNPNGKGRVHLNIVNGLLDGSPIYNGDFADPFALHVGSNVYLYASDTISAHIPVLDATATTDFTGQYLGDALPTLPSWTFRVPVGPGGLGSAERNLRHVLRHPRPAPSSACIKDAHRSHVSAGLCYLAWSTETASASPGPSHSRRPARSSTTRPARSSVPDARAGAIDPSIFVTSDGTPYLLWKSDGNGYGLPTAIYSQRLTSDGLAVAGPPHRLISATQPWEGNLVEGPSMVQDGKTYWLFYSANDWDTPHYAVGIAKCASIDGPCTKPLDHPWVSTANDVHHDQGPGGQEFVTIGGFVWMVHHGWLPGQAGTPKGQRRLYVDLLTFDDPGGLPEVAPAPLAAALADVVDGASVPTTPTNPQQAYLSEVHKSASSFAKASDATLLALGQATCTALAGHGSPRTLVEAMIRKGSDPFGKAVPVAFAVQRLCPQYLTEAREQLQQILYTPS